MSRILVIFVNVRSQSLQVWFAMIKYQRTSHGERIFYFTKKDIYEDRTHSNELHFNNDIRM